MGDLTIRRSELQRHIQQLRDIAGSGKKTVSTADTAAIGNHGLYGVVGRMLVVPPLTALLHQQQDTLHSFAALLDEVANHTQGALAEYQIVEDANAAAANQIKVP